jgi:hypothetical protein
MTDATADVVTGRRHRMRQRSSAGVAIALLMAVSSLVHQAAAVHAVSSSTCTVNVAGVSNIPGGDIDFSGEIVCNGPTMQYIYNQARLENLSGTPVAVGNDPACWNCSGNQSAGWAPANIEAYDRVVYFLQVTEPANANWVSYPPECTPQSETLVCFLPTTPFLTFMSASSSFAIVTAG